MFFQILIFSKNNLFSIQVKIILRIYIYIYIHTHINKSVLAYWDFHYTHKKSMGPNSRLKLLHMLFDKNAKKMINSNFIPNFSCACLYIYIYI
jgi:hypothetical protein